MTIKIGDTFKTNDGKVTVVEYHSYSKIVVRKEDGSTMTTKGYDLNRNIAGVLAKDVIGNGVVGDGEYGIKEHRKAYRIWIDIMKSCTVEHAEYTISDDWRNFQNFARDYYSMFKTHKDGLCINSTLLDSKNRHYSMETCLVIPRPVHVSIIKVVRNSSLPTGVTKRTHYGVVQYAPKIKISGAEKNLSSYSTPERAFAVYKRFKECEIHRLAYLYKDSLEERAFDALMKFEVTPY